MTKSAETTPGDIDVDQKQQEFELKKAEITLKIREAESRGKGIAMLQLGIWGALVTAITGLFTTWLQGTNNRATQEREHLATLAHERAQLQSALIQKAISGLDENKAKQNLKFLWESGLLADDLAESQRQMAKYIQGLDNKSSTVPAFPVEASPVFDSLTKAVSQYRSATSIADQNQSLYEISVNARRLATLLLAKPTDTGAPVLAADYFVVKSKEQFADRRTILDTNNLLPTVVIVAQTMLKVAEKSEKNTEISVLEWNVAKYELREKLTEFNTDKDANMWIEFLAQWQDDVTERDRSRFRDALIQAAHSILRLGVGSEEEHVDALKGSVSGNQP